MKQPTSLQTLKNQVQNAQELKKENQLLKLPLVFRDAFIVPNGTSGFEQLLHQAAVLEVLIPPLCSHHCCFSPLRASRFPARFSSFVLSVLLNLLSQCFSFVFLSNKTSVLSRALLHFFVSGCRRRCFCLELVLSIVAALSFSDRSHHFPPQT